MDEGRKRVLSWERGIRVEPYIEVDYGAVELQTGESISSLDAIPTRWEYGEYASAAIVIVGVVGEFLADFSNVWSVRDVPERWDKLGKLSTLVLIAGLAAELVCLVNTNVLSKIASASSAQTGGVLTNVLPFSGHPDGMVR